MPGKRGQPLKKERMEAVRDWNKFGVDKPPKDWIDEYNRDKEKARQKRKERKRAQEPEDDEDIQEIKVPRPQKEGMSKAKKMTLVAKYLKAVAKGETPRRIPTPEVIDEFKRWEAATLANCEKLHKLQDNIKRSESEVKKNKAASDVSKAFVSDIFKTAVPKGVSKRQEREMEKLEASEWMPPPKKAKKKPAKKRNIRIKGFIDEPTFRQPSPRFSGWI